MTPAEFRDIRKSLGLSQQSLAEVWNMGKHGGRRIRRWEAGDGEVDPLAAWAIQRLGDERWCTWLKLRGVDN